MFFGNVLKSSNPYNLFPQYGKWQINHAWSSSALLSYLQHTLNFLLPIVRPCAWKRVRLWFLVIQKWGSMIVKITVFFNWLLLLFFSITLRFITSTLQLPLSHPLPLLSNKDITPITLPSLLTTKLEIFKDINCIIEILDLCYLPYNQHKGSHVMPEVS